MVVRRTFARVMIFRKDAEISNVNSKLESEQNLVAQLQKKIKELQASIPQTSFYERRNWCEG